MRSDRGDTSRPPRRRWILVALLLGVVVVVGGRLTIALVPPPVVGIRVNALHPCPDADNCVRSGATDPRHAVEPLTCPPERMDEVVEFVLQELERTELVEYTDGYAHLTASSRWIGFVDDVELLADGSQLQVRSAARLGRNDFGVNRERVERLRDQLEQAAICG